MAYPVEGRRVHLLKLLRQFATTAAATAAGIAYVVMHPSESHVQLKPGDPAPDFSLQGSDGRTYRLKDLAGRPVVVAWFPKAFTGG
jgi:peroxiredoxin